LQRLSNLRSLLMLASPQVPPNGFPVRDFAK
jgi:hypothetical protein